MASRVPRHLTCLLLLLLVCPTAALADLDLTGGGPFSFPGAYHVIGTHEWLGNLWHAEDDGQPTPDASGDDTNDLDDEDGVELYAGGADVTIAVSDRDSGRYGDTDETRLWLDAWWDSNRDGTFDNSEHIVHNYYNPATWGSNQYADTIDIPGFQPRQEGDAFRWRLSYGDSDVQFYGGQGYGEVEDYVVTPEPGSLALLGAGLLALARRRRKKSRA